VQSSALLALRQTVIFLSSFMSMCKKGVISQKSQLKSRHYMPYQSVSFPIQISLSALYYYIFPPDEVICVSGATTNCKAISSKRDAIF